ncbi:MAG: hypothetical protein EBS05_13515 [Proteobacteria bacterium]|nr:hypothetical protein [Pseudomonadota bacterium]
MPARGNGLPGVSISVGTNSVISDASGNYAISNLAVGPVLIIATNTGYVGLTNALTLTNSPTNLFNFTMSPVILGANALRIVLTWGAQPRDLDSYTLTPTIGGTTHEISFFNKGSLTAAPFAQLDVDDTSGFGPETTSITNLFPGTYEFYVNNFSGTPVLAGCGAQVQVYTAAGLIQTITEPATGTGDYWRVLLIDGNSGQITVLNTLTNVQPTTPATLAPVILDQPASQTGYLNNTVTFSAAASGQAPLAYQWFFNSNPIGSATNALLTLSNLQANQTGNYFLVVTNSLGSVTSSIATLTVLISSVPFVTVPPQSQTRSVGQSAFFSVTAAGLPPLGYQWFKDGAAISGAIGNILSLGPARTNQAGNYTVVVSNSAGSVTSSLPAVLTVTPPPTTSRVLAWGKNTFGQATVPAGLSNVTAIAAGDLHTAALKSDGTVVAWGYNVGRQTNVPPGLSGVTAIAAGNSHTVALKSDGTVVQWGSYPSGGSSVPAGLSNVTAIAAGGQHTVALKSDGTVVAWGNNSNGELRVPAGLSGVTAIAAGHYNTVALKSDGTVVAWGDDSYGQTTVPVVAQSGVTAIAAGAYHTVASKSDGTVVAWGRNDFAQTTGTPTTNSPTIASPVTLNGQVLSGVTALGVGDLHTVALQSDGAVAAWGYNVQGQTTGTPSTNSPFSAIASPVTLNGQVLSGVTAIAVGGSHTVALVDASAPQITAQPVSQSILANQSATFTVAATGAGPITYQWSFNGTNLASATNASYTVAVASGASAGIYQVRVTGAYGYTDSVLATLTVDTSGVPAINTQPQGQSVLAGTVVTLTVSAVGAPPLSYQWRKNGTNLAGQTYSFLPLGGATINTAGSYSVVVTNVFGAVTSAPAVITVIQVFPPVVTNPPAGQTALVGTDVTFSVACSGTPPFNYQWVFGGVAIPNNDQPTLTITNVSLADAGNYFVQVFNSSGLASSAPARLVVQSLPTFVSLPADATILQGGTNNFTAIAVSTPPTRLPVVQGRRAHDQLGELRQRDLHEPPRLQRPGRPVRQLPGGGNQRRRQHHERPGYVDRIARARDHDPPDQRDADAHQCE